MKANKLDSQVEAGASAICTLLGSALHDKEGLLIGRNGTIEFQTIMATLSDSSIFFLSPTLENNAGIFHDTCVVKSIEKSVDEWVQEYMMANIEADVMVAGWFAPTASAELEYLHSCNPKAIRIPLRSLEPYYCAPQNRWTRFLAGQKVCVVSSFAESMAEQLKQKKNIWPAGEWETLLPDRVEWSFVRSYYPPSVAQGVASWPQEIVCWQDALDYLETKVVETGADIVLIGCGGLGMPLGYRLKRQGKIAIVMGGAIQVLFGIKGGRWKSHPIISKFWNASWVSPKPSETPKGASTVEGACYW